MSARSGRYRKKLIDKKQAAISFLPRPSEEEDEVVQDDEIQIVKTKKFAIEPTIPEGKHASRWRCWDTISTCS